MKFVKSSKLNETEIVLLFLTTTAFTFPWNFYMNTLSLEKRDANHNNNHLVMGLYN